MSVRTADVERLRRALGASSGDVRFSATLPHSTAEKVLTLLREEQKAGAVVVPARNEFRTTEAAAMLGMSRGHLSQLINDGQIAARQVGAHWRIPATEIVAFQERTKAKRATRMERLTELENEDGLPD